jgi:hypothetical protein
MSDSNNEIESLKAENELLKFKVESAERLTAHEKLIREVERYKHFLQSALMFFGLGSLGGILALIAALIALPAILNNYLDQQIAAQVRKWNDLDTCIAVVREARWRVALKNLKTVYQKEVKLAKTSDQDYRSLLFNTLVFVLSSTNERMLDGQRWQGEDEWNELCQDSAFRDEFLTRSEDNMDETYCNEMFYCTLKFYKEPNVLERVRAYIREALHTIAEDRSKAPHYFDLAMADLVAGDPASALRNLKEASDKDPSTYQDLSNYLNTFKNSVQFTMWHLCAERSHVDFDSAMTRLIDRIRSTAMQQ